MAGENSGSLEKMPNLYPQNFALRITHVFCRVLTVSCGDVAASLFRKDDCFPTTPIHGSTLKQKEVDKANQLAMVAMEEKKASVRGHYSI